MIIGIEMAGDLILYKLTPIKSMPEFLRCRHDSEPKKGDPICDDYIWSSGGASFSKTVAQEMLDKNKVYKCYVPSFCNADREEVFDVLEKWLAGQTGRILSNKFPAT